MFSMVVCNGTELILNISINQLETNAADSIEAFKDMAKRFNPRRRFLGSVDDVKVGDQLTISGWRCWLQRRELPLRKMEYTKSAKGKTSGRKNKKKKRKKTNKKGVVLWMPHPLVASDLTDPTLRGIPANTRLSDWKPCNVKGLWICFLFFFCRVACN